MLGCGAFLDLVAPVVCAGCGAPGRRWCGGCAEWVDQQPMVRAVEPSGVRLAARSWYEGPLAAAIVAWKSHGRADVAGVLAHYLADAVQDVAHDVPVVLVPVPSLPANNVRRGRAVLHHVTQLAGELVGAACVPGLVRRRGGTDQAGLSARARQHNMSGAMVPLGAVLAGRRVVVVDDIVTTGATAMECVRAVRSAQALSVAVAALCSAR